MIDINGPFSCSPTWGPSSTRQYGPRLADVTITTEDESKLLEEEMSNRPETLSQKRRRLALAILPILREFEEENGELKVTYINIERVSGYGGDAEIGGVDVTVEVR